MLALALACLALAAPAAAQSIHGHPQKAAYASSAEWPPLSGQCQLFPSPMIAHYHFEPNAPIYAVNAGEPFTMRFAVKLFMLPGHIQFLGGDMVQAIVWDATGTSTPPDHLTGDPHGLKTWTGQITLAPLQRIASNLGGFGPPLPVHGWFIVNVTARVQLDNGTRVDTDFGFPMWSNLDPTAPIENQPQVHGPSLGMGCFQASLADASIWPPVDPAVFGKQITQVDDYLPILGPLTGSWPVHSFTYGYVPAPHLPDGTYELREDMDLHNGIPGTLLRTNTAPNALGGGSEQTDVLTPELIGSGTHKLAFIWHETTGAGFPGGFTANEESWSLVVVNVTAGEGVPPPPVVVLPPPPPAKACSGTVTGTSVDGTTVAVTGGSVVCR